MRLVTRTEGANRGRVGDPIDPGYLRFANQIRTDSAKRARPMAPGTGSQTYRLYCNEGLWGWDGQMGLLRLEAVSGKDPGEEEIRFLQVSRDGGSQSASGRFAPFQAVFRLEGSMRCRGDVPESWELESALYDYTRDPEGVLLDGSRLREIVRVRGGEMEVTINDRVHRRALPGLKWMAEWNLLRLVGRLPFGVDPQLSFCLLEGLTLPKTDAHLLDTGRHNAPAFGGDLYSFSLLGRGIVPYDFWLDADHRLLGCISGGLGRAYLPEGLMIPAVNDFLGREFQTRRAR